MRAIVLVLSLGCAHNATERESVDLRFARIEADAATSRTVAQERHDAHVATTTANDTALAASVSETALALRAETRGAVAALAADTATVRRGLSERLAAAARAADDALSAAATDRARSRAGLSERIAVQRGEIESLRSELVGIRSRAGTKATEDARLRAEAAGDAHERQTDTLTAIGALPTRSWVTARIDEHFDEREAVARPEIVAEAQEITTKDYSQWGIAIGALLTALGALARGRQGGQA